MIDATQLPVEWYYSEPAARQRALDVCAARVAVHKTIRPIIQGSRLDTEMLACARAGRGDLSGFYKWVAGFSTPLFAEARLVDFGFYKARPGDTGTYGVEFNLWMLTRTRDLPRSPVRMLPTALLADGSSLTEIEAAVLDNILALDEPVPRISFAVGDRVTDLGPSVVDGLRVLERGAPIQAPLSVHRPIILLSTRTEDVTAAEIALLQRVVAARAWKRVEVLVRRVGSYAVPHLPPIEIVDVLLYY